MMVSKTLLKWMVVAVSLLPISAHAEIFKVLQDKTALLRLKQPATVVLVGNPDIADVTVRSDRFILVHGRSIGETNLIILDGNDREVITYDIVVSPQIDRHISVNRAAELVTMSCDPRCTTVDNPEGRRVEETAGDTGLGEEDTGTAEGATN